MLDILYNIEKQLPALLQDKDRWHGLYIGYHPPIVWRAWTQIDDYRISLHIIEECKVGQALMHPHPWPSAIKVIKGPYEMEVGYAKGNDVPPVAATIILSTGSYYEMKEYDGWHSVRPLDKNTMSIMISGKPWNRNAPGGGQGKELSAEETNKIIEQFVEYYK